MVRRRRCRRQLMLSDLSTKNVSFAKRSGSSPASPTLLREQVSTSSFAMSSRMLISDMSLETFGRRTLNVMRRALDECRQTNVCNSSIQSGLTMRSMENSLEHASLKSTCIDQLAVKSISKGTMRRRIDVVSDAVDRSVAEHHLKSGWVGAPKPPGLGS